MVDNRVEDILYDVFDVKISDKDKKDYIENVLKWDSFNIMNLLVETDNRFHKRLDLEKIFSIKTVGELIQIIEDTIG